MKGAPRTVIFVLLAALGAVPRAHSAASGALRVLGQASAAQESGIRIQRCETAPDGQPARFGCSTVAEGALNEDVALAPGRYRVEFSSTFSPLIEVRAGERVELQLARIRVPDGGGARLFHDLNDARERSWFLSSVLTHSGNASLFESDCQEGLPGPLSESLTRRACAAVRSGRPEELLGTVIRIDPDASWSSLGYSAELLGHGIGASFENQGRLWINERREPAGGAVYVFPGVYGIEITLPDGRITEKYGILAQTG